ncbi:MAG: hypothetical protein LBI18_16040 [Planctomycetaceae bacterium]|jgi:hypothetical protein|nr:hypothetical protein [Planctomycetaceae bacterium]
MKNQYFFYSAGFIILFLLTTGCNAKTNSYHVSGTVTLDGQPLTETLVMFSPTQEGKGEMACGYTKEDGLFEIQTPDGKADSGTTFGEYFVTFTKTESRWDGHSYHYDEVTKTKTQEKVLYGVEVVPKIYTAKETTPFTVMVEKQNNKFMFELKTQ